MRSEQEIKAKIDELENKLKRNRELFDQGKMSSEIAQIKLIECNSKIVMLEWVLGAYLE